uniref:Amiloride-sensitive sodium channel n=1 Tax=Rhabditophanes sp. KR3021 TaxID=114890 RepID=A0AC35TVA4_9BILA
MKPHYHIDETKAETDSLKGSCFNKSFRKYCFWFIIAFLAALTIKDVYDLCVEYSENPKKADMNIMFNETMQLPNITFCLSRDQAWSHFKISKNDTNEIWDQVIKDDLANMTDKKSFLEKQWEDKSIMEAYEIIATLSSMERETTAHGSMRSINVFRIQPRLKKKREIIKKWLDAIHERKVTFEEFTQKVGTEVIRRSLQRFQRTSYDENLVIKTKLKTSWISMMQFCFQPWYDEENYKLIADQGNFFTMMLSHNADNLEGKDLECMSVDFHGRPSSLSRFMEGKGRVKDGFIDELCHGQRHEVTVEIRARYKMLENDDEGTACRDVEAGEDNEFNCRSRCRMEMIKKACNCTAATLSYLVKEEDLATFPVCDYSKCEVDVQRGNFSDAECSKNCYRECDQIRYEVDHASKGKMVRGDLTLVNLNWGSFEFLTLEQDWVWTLATFIAGLGGSIGIWLGLSILSLIEGSTFLYKYFHAKILKKRSRVAAEERQSQIKRNEAREVAGGKNGTSIEIGNLGKS